MTISNFRSSEPLYIIIVRENNAEKWLRQWAQTTSSQVTIEGNRMKVFEQRSLSRFHMDWPHSWDNVAIWDCWNKRHIWPVCINLIQTLNVTLNSCIG